MCLQYIKIKNKTNKSGLSYAYVPCGKCADCRAKEYNAWRFRVRTEFNALKDKGWNVGFITLTYDEKNLPKIPKKCFQKEEEYKEISCFNKNQVRNWISEIRHYCKYHYKMVNGDNLRYFITSEYGELTHRPHYHAILAWNPKLTNKNGETCDYKTMHALCKHFWTYGLVGPKEYVGDNNCKSFEIQGDSTACLSYVCKYVSKDISYVDKVKNITFYENPKQYEENSKERELARCYTNCTPFHLQSVSLGYEPIKNLSDNDKLNLIKNGACFIGDDKTYEIPMYIKNKIIYNNYYVVDENGKRLVRREASQFFEENRDEFFEKKAKFYDKFINQIDKSFLEKAGVENDIIEKIMNSLNQYWDKVREHVDEKIVNNIGQYYLAYNAVQHNRCFDIPLVEQWMLRYRRPENVEECYQDEQWPLFDGYQLSWLQLLWNYINCIYFYVNRVKIAEREEKEKLEKKLKDFWNNIT